MSDQTPPVPKNSIKVSMEEGTAQGKYANLVMVSHGESEFVLDFMFLQPGRNEARVGSRVIVSPRQAKRLISALSENLTRYEHRFGPVPTPITPKSDDIMH